MCGVCRVASAEEGICPSGSFTGPRVTPHAPPSPGSPHCFPQRADAVLSCCHQQNCQPLSQSTFILLAPTGAAEHLVGESSAVRRGVFFQTDNPIPQKVRLAVSNPPLSLNSEFHHLVTCCRPHTPQGPTTPRADGHRLFQKACFDQDLPGRTSWTLP